MWNFFAGCLFSFCMVGYGLKKKALSKDGAIAGFLVGICSWLFGGYRAAFVLLMFFTSSSKLTRFREMIKKKVEHDHKKGGQRNYVQVFANGFTGCLCAILFAIFYNLEISAPWMNILDFEELPLDAANHLWSSMLLLGFLAHYACCNGDTWASEIGIASGGANPLLLFGLNANGSPILFRRVPRGTNGGISTVGTVASILGGLLIGFSFSLITLLLNDFSLSLFQFAEPCFYGTFAGFAGSMIDSFLGGALQYSLLDTSGKIVESKPTSDASNEYKHITGIGILDNHQVNFLASLLTAVCTSGLYYITASL